MARISGVDIPREKRLEIALTYIYGIGRTKSQEICDATTIDRNTRVRDLTDEEVSKIRAYIDANVKVEGDLRREVDQDIKRKMEIGCYQGLRPPAFPSVSGAMRRVSAGNLTARVSALRGRCR
jgi:small subunit ribosomal protein S13